MSDNDEPMLHTDGLYLAIHTDGRMQGVPPGIDLDPGWHLVTWAEYHRTVEGMSDNVRDRFTERLAADAAQSN